jgi:hypothetical protein
MMHAGAKAVEGVLGGRNENMPRTFKEICAVVQDTNKKEIGRCYKAIIKELETNVGVTHVSDYMRRWGSQLGLSNREMRAGTEIADVACPRDGMYASASSFPSVPCRLVSIRIPTLLWCCMFSGCLELTSIATDGFAAPQCD